MFVAPAGSLQLRAGHFCHYDGHVGADEEAGDESGGGGHVFRVWDFRGQTITG